MKLLACLVLCLASFACSSKRPATDRELLEASSVYESAQKLIKEEIGRDDVQFAALTAPRADSSSSGLLVVLNDSVEIFIHSSTTPTTADVKTWYRTKDSTGRVALALELNHGWRAQSFEHAVFTAK